VEAVTATATTQLSFDDALRAKNEALATVDANAPSDWKRRADDALDAVARREREFTSDAVWVELGMEQPPEPRAIGPVVLRGVKRGIIRATDRYAASEMVSCHGRRKMVWASLICEV
jgi:hypothetical protein